MLPEAALGVEAVQREQLPRLVREEVDCLEDVVEDLLAREVVEAQTDERELRAEVAGRRLALHPCRRLLVDPAEAVDVWPCAEAPASRLDPEQIVEERNHEVRVQQPARVAQAERHDREPLELRVAEDLDPAVGAPGGERAP